MLKGTNSDKLQFGSACSVKPSFNKKFRRENVARWREKQAKLKADREAKAAEEAQPFAPPQAEIAPVVESVATEVLGLTLRF